MFNPEFVSSVLEKANSNCSSNADIAHVAISLLDLTSLNSDDTKEDIISLCQRAQSPAGNTAAVCVYAQFIETAWRTLGDSGIKIATVVNFPSGNSTAQQVADETANAIAAGADEIDLVLPYQQFLAGDEETAAEVIDATKNACGADTTLKVILESGSFVDPPRLYDASRLALAHGANFIKTSTGKAGTGATPEAAAIMISALKDADEEQGIKAGFKASGGVKTTADAALYMAIAKEIMGNTWVSPQTFRFGASGVLSALLESCGHGRAKVSASTPDAGNY